MNKISLLGLLLLLAAACRPESDTYAYPPEKECVCEGASKVLSYRVYDSYELPVQGLQYDYTAMRIRQTPEGIELWGLDQGRNRLDVYELRRRAFRDSLRIAREGPGSIRKIYDFLPIGPDSIFIHTNEYWKLHLIDGKARIYRTWNLRHDLPTGVPVARFYPAAFPKNNYGIAYDGTNILCGSMYNFGRPYSREAYLQPMVLVFGLAKDTFSHAFGLCPPNFTQEDKNTYEMYYPFISWNGHKAVSFSESHCLMFFDHEYRGRTVCARSRYLPATFDLLAKDQHISVVNLHARTHGDYRNLVHDPYRRLIYRVATHAQPDKNAQGLLNHKLHAPWSLMVLDEKGVVLGECLMEGAVWDFRAIYPLPEGILISRENPYNPQNEEDILSFDLIELQGL